MEHWQFFRFLAGFFAFHCLNLSSEFMCRGLFKRLSFTKENEVAWNSRIVSTIHAILVAQAATRCIIYNCDSSRNDLVNGGCDLLDHYLPISLGYLTYDLILCLINPKLREFSMLVHHTVTIALELFYLETQYGVLWSSYYLQFEMTTPILNLMYHLRKLDWDRVYIKTSTAIMTIFYAMWMIFRVLPCIYLTWMTYSLWIDIARLNLIRIIFLFFSLFSFSSLNFYWFYLINLKMIAKIRELTTVGNSVP